MPKASTILTRVQRRFPDITNAIALEYLNMVNRDAYAQWPLRVEQFDAQTTLGEPLIPLRSDVAVVWTVEYVSSATAAPITLNPTETSFLEDEHYNWRGLSNSMPRQYAIEGENLRVLPPPNLTATDGYPLLRVHLSRLPVDLTINDYTTPTLPVNGNLYYTGICYYFALDEDQGESEAWGQRYRAEVLLAENYLHRKNIRYKPRAYIGTLRPTSTVV